jgi:Fe-Mn family superoxide dismutase
MPFELPALPFPLDSLEPQMSRQTLEFHYGKHHKGYVDKLNELVKDTDLKTKSLEDLILLTREENPEVFHNAAQVWNHTFFWNCLTPTRKKPGGDLEDHFVLDFDSLDEFKEQFSAQAKNLFGSGWTWLVLDRNGRMKIKSMGNAGNPITTGDIPLLTCDVWEHAYYLDYQNARPKFIENFWNIVNWSFVQKNIEHADEVRPRRSRLARSEESARI